MLQWTNHSAYGSPGVGFGTESSEPVEVRGTFGWQSAPWELSTVVLPRHFSLSRSARYVRAGGTGEMYVGLGETPNPDGTTVTVRANGPGVNVPSTVHVPAGEPGTTIPLSTTSAFAGDVTVTATWRGQTSTNTVYFQAGPAPTPTPTPTPTATSTPTPTPTATATPSPTAPGCAASNGNDVSIPDLTTVESTITIAGCQHSAATSATVDVHIKHTYIGDLNVTLVAPDGSTYPLDTRTGGSTDDLDQTYTVDLSSEPRNGTWKLRVQDAAAADIDRITCWTLTL